MTNLNFVNEEEMDFLGETKPVDEVQNEEVEDVLNEETNGWDEDTEDDEEKSSESSLPVSEADDFILSTDPKRASSNLTEESLGFIDNLKTNLFNSIDSYSQRVHEEARGELAGLEASQDDFYNLSREDVIERKNKEGEKLLQEALQSLEKEKEEELQEANRRHESEISEIQEKYQSKADTIHSDLMTRITNEVDQEIHNLEIRQAEKMSDAVKEKISQLDEKNESLFKIVDGLAEETKGKIQKIHQEFLDQVDATITGYEREEEDYAESRLS